MDVDLSSQQMDMDVLVNSPHHHHNNHHHRIGWQGQGKGQHVPRHNGSMYLFLFSVQTERLQKLIYLQYTKHIHRYKTIPIVLRATSFTHLDSYFFCIYLQLSCIKIARHSSMHAVYKCSLLGSASRIHMNCIAWHVIDTLGVQFRSSVYIISHLPQKKKKSFPDLCIGFLRDQLPYKSSNGFLSGALKNGVVFSTLVCHQHTFISLI